MTARPNRFTRPSGALLSALLLIVIGAIPGDAAHTGVGPREIDVAVLTDDDGFIAYGGCVLDPCPPAPIDGLDLIGLDMREAALGDGAPYLVFRVLFAAPDQPAPDRVLRVTFQASGQGETLDVAGPETATPQAPGADRVVGPTPLGDGGVLELEVWASAARFGLTANDTIQDIRVRSLTGASPDDDMPGAWFYRGVEVSHVPEQPTDPGEALEDRPPGTYTLQGPAALIRLDAALVPVLSASGLWLNVTSPLEDLEQSVAVALVGEGIASIRVEPPSFQLAPGATQPIRLVPTGSLPDGPFLLRVSSDLGGWTEASILVAPPAVGATPSDASSSEPARGAPGAEVGLLLALAFVAASRRRLRI